jgi:hypothetical protein
MVYFDRIIEHEILTSRLVLCTRNMWLNFVCVSSVNSDLECNLQTIGRYEGIYVFQKSDIIYDNNTVLNVLSNRAQSVSNNSG